MYKAVQDKKTVVAVCYQSEIAPTTGTPHIQGWIRFADRKTRFTTWCRRYGFPIRAQFKTFRGYDEDGYEYCRKDESRDLREGYKLRYYRGIPKSKRRPKIIEPLKTGWQALFKRIIESEPHDRLIYWFYEKKGKVGKTTMSRWAAAKKDAVILGGKSQDMFYGIITAKEKMGEVPKTLIFDIPRCTEKFVSWGGIEKSKDMCFFSGKYESASFCDAKPHCIIFANFEPPYENLSYDRWRIIEIQSLTEFKAYTIRSFLADEGNQFAGWEPNAAWVKQRVSEEVILGELVDEGESDIVLCMPPLERGSRMIPSTDSSFEIGELPDLSSD
jgi:hypothetical protein